MSDPKYTTLSELQLLFHPESVKNQKINCIKALRQISGDGLKESKNFFEHVVVPAILESKFKVMDGIAGSAPTPPPSDSSENLPPPMYLVGMTYLQVDKVPVLIVGVANHNTSYESVYSIGSDGMPIHRYNRRDFGRVTGTHDSPYNLKVLDQ